MDFLNFNSVETIPGFEARAASTVSSASVFKEDVDIVPTILSDRISYVPWGGDNLMPFDILALVEKDETLATCQIFNAEVCYDRPDPAAPWRDLQERLAKGSRSRKFAIVSRIPTVDSTYYPIPYYAALLRGMVQHKNKAVNLHRQVRQPLFMMLDL